MDHPADGHDTTNASGTAPAPQDEDPIPIQIPPPNTQPQPQAPNTADLTTTLAESCTMISTSSLHKLFLIATTTLILAYAAVSPRTLPPVPYNAAFKSNINLVLLLYIAPVAYLLGVSNIRSDSDNATDVNAIIHIFYTSFTYGYIATFLLEALLATALRIAAFIYECTGYCCSIPVIRMSNSKL